MGAVGRGKRIVDVDIAKRRKPLGKAHIIGFFTGIKPQVFQKQNLVVLHFFDRIAVITVCKRNRHAQLVSDSRGDMD